MNRTEAEQIGRAIHVIRPDWPVAQITTILGRDHQQATMADALIALAVAAADPQSRTPARINEGDFRGWKAACVASGTLSLDPADKPTPRPPRSDEACAVHAGGWRDNCAGCNADQLTASPPLARFGEHQRSAPNDTYREARKALRNRQEIP